MPAAAENQQCEAKERRRIRRPGNSAGWNRSSLAVVAERGARESVKTQPMNWIARWTMACGLALLMLVTGCPGTKRHVLVAEVPRSGDAAARSRFIEARTAFLRDGSQAEAFEQLRDDFPDDPIAPWVGLYRGISLLKKGEFASAEQALAEVPRSELPPALAARITLYRGVAKARGGDNKGALALLGPQAATMRTLTSGGNAQAEREFVEARAEYWAALGLAQARTEPIAALASWDQYTRGATAAEKMWAVQQIEAIVAELNATIISGAWQREAVRSAVPSGIVLARRVARDQAALGQAATAATTLAGVASAAAEWQIPLDAPAGTNTATADAIADPRRVSALVPSGSKQQRVADSMVAALAQVSGAGGGDGIAVIDVQLQNDAATAMVAVEAVAQGISIAAIGPLEASAVDAAAGRAEKLGLPLVSLSPRADERTTGTYIFHIMHSAEARARQLARKAYAKGLSRFAVLAPSNGYGKAVAAAFAEEVASLGAQVTTRVDYPADTKSFAGVAGKLSGSWQAVFIPEQADRLELIAPALAAAGLMARPIGTTKAIGGRAIVLLSTAEGMGPNFLINVGRHCEGGLFAPGYFAGTDDAKAKAFDTGFAAAHGRPPSAFEAYVYDAVAIIIGAGAGSVSRTTVAEAMARGSIKGLTGEIRFDADHRRSDDGVVYTVVGAETALRVVVMP